MGIILKNAILKGIRSDIRIDKGFFTEVSPHIAATEDDTVIDAENNIIIPSLKNGHTHSAMTLLRGWGDDMELKPWLEEKIWPMEAAIIQDPEASYWGTRFACLEMVKSGTTFANDMYFNQPQNIRAFRESGMKAALGTALFDFFDIEKTKKMKALCEKEFNIFEQSSMMQYTVAPHSIYTVSKELLSWAGNFSKEHNLPMHIHLCETREEVDESLSSFGKSPVAYLKNLGLLSPRLIAAHTVWLSDDDIQMLADYGVTVVHNPVSNMKLSVGSVFPFNKIKTLHIPMMLGTDGAASNNNLDMFEEMKFAALLQKHHTGNPELMKAEEIFAIASGSKSSIFPHISGEIKPGNHADCLLLNPDHPGLNPDHNTLSNIVYAAGSSCIDTVISGGTILMRHGKIDGEERILTGFRQAVKKLFS